MVNRNFHSRKISLSLAIKAKLFLITWNRTKSIVLGTKVNGPDRDGPDRDGPDRENKRHANANEVTSNNRYQHEIMQTYLSHFGVGSNSFTFHLWNVGGKPIHLSINQERNEKQSTAHFLQFHWNSIDDTANWLFIVCAEVDQYNAWLHHIHKQTWNYTIDAAFASVHYSHTSEK